MRVLDMWLRTLTCRQYPQDQLAEVARRIPDCRLVTIEGAGHRVHDSKPDAFLGVVREFLVDDNVKTT